MNTEQIQKFLAQKINGNENYVKIDFKTRDSIYGLFITHTQDYQDLRTKNFWRIVTRKHFDNYNKSKSLEYARIFNGSEFTRLSLLTEEF
jgi:hypothetical protein